MTRIAAACRWLSRRIARAADRLDPPPVGDAAAHVDRMLATMAAVRSGAIRRRPRETEAAFVARLVAGDFEVEVGCPVIDFATERARRAQSANTNPNQRNRTQ